MPTPGNPIDPSKRSLGRITARRGQMSFTYLLTLLENVFELMYPWAIGIGINGLLVGKWQNLLLLVGIWLAHIIIGAFRQLFDTRLFARLYADMATDIVTLQSAQGEEVSEISARVEMADEFITFFEAEMPVILATIASLIGSLFLLFFYDIWAGLIIAGLFIPVSLINFLMGRKALKINNDYNTRWEGQINIIESPRRRATGLHFKRLAQMRIRLSDLDVLSWSFTGFFMMVATLLVLVRVASAPGVLAGDIFASLAYVLRIDDALDNVPALVQQGGRLLDIRARIRSL